MKFLMVAVLILLPFTVNADLVLPVDGPVTSEVGWRVDPFGSGAIGFHRGIDIAVAEGTRVRATRAGIVIFAGKEGGYGNTVIVEHDGGVRTLYGHNKTLSVQKGQQVEAGEVIALSGNSGRSTGPHVHYEIVPQGPLDETLTMAPGKVHVHTALQERMKLDKQLDVIMGSMFDNVRSSLLPSDHQVGG